MYIIYIHITITIHNGKNGKQGNGMIVSDYGSFPIPYV
jgi:hypothetical protein